MDFPVPCRHPVLLLVVLGDGKRLLLVLGIKLIRFALEKSMIFKRYMGTLCLIQIKCFTEALI